MSTIKSSAENLTLNADGSNNDVIIQSNGSTVVTVDGSAGSVGIGTTTPSAKFEVEDGGTSNGNVLLKVTQDDQSSHYGLSVGNDTYNTTDSNGLMINQKNDGHGEIHNGGSINVGFPVAGGMTFGSDTAAANALDDYEEGTFTPQIYVDSSHTGVTYSGQGGAYTKVGNLVTCFVMIGLSSKGSASGNVTFRNLPFTISNSLADTSLDGGCANWGYWGGTSGINYFTFVGNGAVNYATGYAQTGSTGDCSTTFTNSHITDGFSVRFTFQFLTDS